MVGAGLIGALVAGGATASFATSSANSATTQSDTSTTDTSTTDTGATDQAPAQDQEQAPDRGQKGERPDVDPAQGGHTANGKTEELLTGDTATKVTEAALAAVPGATIERVETDAEGAAYEAHLVTSDGEHQTVTFDADFNVVEIQDGPGGDGGPGGKGGGHGRPHGDMSQDEGQRPGGAPAASGDGTGTGTSEGSTSTTAGS